MLPGSLLILDEAHHAAPSSGGRYGIVDAAQMERVRLSAASIGSSVTWTTI
jgi:hypothetical protein